METARPEIVIFCFYVIYLQAWNLCVKNMILYHTEDQNYANRKELYLAEGTPYFSGNLYVPYDLERFTL